MDVTILYFAGLREALGTGRETLSLPAGVLSAGELRALLCERGGEWARALGQGQAVRVAVDQALAQGGTPLHDGAEVAFFPPVTGG